MTKLQFRALTNWAILAVSATLLVWLYFCQTSVTGRVLLLTYAVFTFVKNVLIVRQQRKLYSQMVSKNAGSPSPMTVVKSPEQLAQEYTASIKQDPSSIESQTTNGYGLRQDEDLFCDQYKGRAHVRQTYILGKNSSMYGKPHSFASALTELGPIKVFDYFVKLGTELENFPERKEMETIAFGTFQRTIDDLLAEQASRELRKS